MSAPVLTPGPGRVRWRLDELLLAEGTLSHQAVSDALTRDGAHPIGRTQVCRLVADPPQHVSLALIGALCRVLRCTPNDLLGWDATPEAAVRRPHMSEITARARRAASAGQVPAADALPEGAPRLSEEDRQRIVGPPVRAMAAHPLARRGKSNP